MKTNQLPSNYREKIGRNKALSFISLIMLCCLAFGFKAAADVTINSTVTFTSLDNGDAFPGDGTFQVVGKLTVTSTGEITADGSPNGGDIKITATGDILLQSGSQIHTVGSNGSGGNITIISINGDIIQDPGSLVYTTSTNCKKGGDILIQSYKNGGLIDIDGKVISSSDSSGSCGAGDNQGHGGTITIKDSCTLIVSPTGYIASRGSDPGADLIHLQACAVKIYGVVKSSGAGHAYPSDSTTANHLCAPSHPDKACNKYTAGVEVWADSIWIDGVAPNNGEINADLPLGAAFTSWIDLLAGHYISINNDGVGPFTVHANVGGNGGTGGDITAKSLNGSFVATGDAIQANATGSGDKQGGNIVLHSLSDLNLTNASIEAIGLGVNATLGGGTIDVHAFGPPATLTLTGSSLNTTNGGGTVTETACTAIVGTAAVTPNSTLISNPLTCGGGPDISAQPYVVIPTGCSSVCNPCPDPGSFHFSRVMATSKSVCPEGSSHAALPDSLTFTLNGPLSKIFKFKALADILKDTLINGLPAGSYTLTLTAVPGWTFFVNGNPGLVFSFIIEPCAPKAAQFSAANEGCIPNGCSWCNKSAVLSQVWQNMNGDTCAVPDILVDVRLPHNAANNVVTANELHTGLPATWSIQAAVDYVNLNGDPTPGDGQIFIGVTASSCVNVPLCGKDSSRNPGGDTPYGKENVIITNNWTTRLNIFGCSVTVWADSASKPVFTINNAAGKGKITVLDLHAKGSNVAGYSINNKGDLVIVKNGRAMYNDIGIKVLSTSTGKIELTGSPEISYNRIGISLEGSNTLLRSNNHIDYNTQYGVSISGTANASDGSGIHKNGTGGMIISGSNNDLTPGGDEVSENTGVGITVTGNGNKLHDEDVLSNTSHGIVITGNTNLLEKSKHIEKNGGHGIYVYHAQPTYATGNKLTENVATGNGKDGINANVGNFASTTTLTKNQGNKNTGYGIRPCGQTNGTGNSASGNLGPAATFPNTITFVGCQTRLAGEEDDIDMTEVNLNTITSIYPNPTLGNITISFNSAAAGKFTLKVVDMVGQVVFNEVLVTKEGQNIHDIDLSNVAKGVYTVVLENDGFKDRKTIIVQ